MATYQITSIESQKKNPGRRSIYLDDAFAFGLDEEVVIKHHLHEGDSISDETIRTVLCEEERTRARQKALSLLSYRARSVAEIRERLLQKGYDQKIVDSVVEDFKRVGLLNDVSFASAYVQTRMIRKPMGKRLLIRELLDKGIQKSLASQAVEERYESETEFDIARSLIEHRFERYRRESPAKCIKKVSDFLLRRGFEWEVIGEVIEWVRREMEQC